MVLHTRLDCRGVLDTGTSVLEVVAQPEKGRYQTANYDEQWDGTVCADDDIDKFGWVQSRFSEQGHYAEIERFHC
jgi:hypothetical protein